MAIDTANVLASEGLSLPLLKVLAENSFDSILITDNTKEGKIVYANKAFKKLTGHDPAEVLGKTPRILQGAGTDPKVTERLRDALKTGGKFEGRAINYKKDGTSFWNRFFIAALKSSDGKIVNYVGVQCQVSDALARVLVDMQSRRRNDADGTPLTAEAEVADVSILSASVSSSSSSSASSSAPATTSV